MTYIEAIQPVRSASAKGAAARSDREAVLTGLKARRKYLPSKLFYDETGSWLFERITALEEYYPSRTEKSILWRHAQELMRGVREATLVEIGSGDCSKISLLLQALRPEALRTMTYVPIDVSPSAMEESRQQLRQRFGSLKVRGLVTDFLQRLDPVARYWNKLFCFFGSTIGNLERSQAERFLARLGRMMQQGERLLLGLDMVKERAVLERAYNDVSNVTARFNKNILHVVNRTIGADFDPDLFRHCAFFNEQQRRIEMHLVATCDMSIGSPCLDRDLEIREGESIHTESSYKFTAGDIEAFARCAGLEVNAVYTDENRWFSLVDYLRRIP